MTTTFRLRIAAATVGLLIFTGEVRAQVDETCFALPNGMAMPHGGGGFLPNLKAALVGQTFTYYAYENPYTWRRPGELRFSPPVSLSFSETKITVVQGTETFEQPISFEGNAWCQNDRLTNTRECYVVTARTPLLDVAMGPTPDPKAVPAQAHVGSVARRLEGTRYGRCRGDAKGVLTKPADSVFDPAAAPAAPQGGPRRGAS
jgi:hypothetical protein